MRRQWSLPWAGKSIILMFAFLLGAGYPHYGSAQAQPKLDATVFKYDGQDFVRVQTTLRTEDGRPAINTKLSHDAPAYKALIHKRSYSGRVTLFGRQYDAYYAPLTERGQLTGAIFVAVPR